MDPEADLTVNSLTVTSFVDTPQLQSAAGDLQIQNAPGDRRRHQPGPGRHGGRGQHSERGRRRTSPSLLVGMEVVSNLRVEAPLRWCAAILAASVLTIQGGSNGVLVDDTLLVNGAIAPEPSMPYLYLSGGTSGVQVNSTYAEVTGLGAPGGFCELVIINQASTGVARLYLTTQNDSISGGKGEIYDRIGGGKGADRLRGPGRAGQREAGRDDVQDQKFWTGESSWPSTTRIEPKKLFPQGTAGPGGMRFWWAFCAQKRGL